MKDFLQPYVITGYLTAIVTLSVGLFVFSKNTHSVIHRAFLFFSLAIFQWSFFTALHAMQTEARWGLFWGKFCHIGVLMIPVFFYYFTIKITGRNHPRILKAGFAVSFTLILLTLMTSHFIPTVRSDVLVNFLVKAGPLYCLIILFFFAFILLGLIDLWQEMSLSIGARQKHLFYLFWASIVGYGLGGINFFPVYGIVVWPYPYSAICGALYFCILAYAILRHQLFDIQVIIKRSLVFTLLFASVYMTVSVLIFFVGHAFTSNSPFLSAVSIALAMGVYEPLKKLLERVTNKILFQKRTEYALLIEGLTNQLLNIRDLPTLSEKLVDFLSVHMATDWVGLYLKDHEAPHYILRSSRGSPPIRTLEKDDSIVELALAQRYPLILRPFDIEENLDPEIKARLRESKIEALVPIFVEENLYGILVLGKKKSGDVFGREDEALLHTVMDEVVMLFLSLKLLDEATRANFELSHHMKMAALVQLSRGIQHEARNPLHAIAFCAAKNLHYCSEGIYDDMPENLFGVTLNRSIELVTQDIQRIKATLERFALLTRPKTGFELKALGIKDEFGKFLTLMRDAKKLEHIQIHDGIPADIYIQANEGVLQEIFFNLFNNAYDAMKGQGELFVETEITDSSVKLRLRDTGHGIPEEIRSVIFDEYFTTKENTEAVGIGLSIVRHLMEKLRGSIESAPCSRGAEFILSFQKAGLRKAA